MPTNPKKRTPESQDALACAENIIATLQEPFVVLDKSLRVRTANTAFYRDFHTSKEETEGRFVYVLGNSQWDIPQPLDSESRIVNDESCQARSRVTPSHRPGLAGQRDQRADDPNAEV